MDRVVEQVEAEATREREGGREGGDGPFDGGEPGAGLRVEGGLGEEGEELVHVEGRTAEFDLSRDVGCSKRACVFERRKWIRMSK